MNQHAPATILVADWGKSRAKRSVYEAHVGERRVKRVDSLGWDLHALLSAAQSRAEDGPVLIALDLALGVPYAYWTDLLKSQPGARPSHFLEWLRSLPDEAEFWTEVRSAEEWCVHRPFYAVPKGLGAMKAFYTKAGYDFDRRVDKRCRSKPLFCVSGIPGTVGSGTRAFWRELIPMLAAPRNFSVWPFDGGLEDLLRGSNIVLAEMYPGIAHTVALRESIPSAIVNVAKTKQESRSEALDLFSNSVWLKELSVTLENVDEARANEDDFDAFISAASLLRCVLERHPIDEPSADDAVCEGGVLLTSAVDFSQKRQRFGSGRTREKQQRVRSPPRMQPSTHTPLATAKTKLIQFECPIPGCSKLYQSGRLGWGSHVGALRMHPHWHPHATDLRERKRLFKGEFPDW
jgi:hypothetical protein